MKHILLNIPDGERFYCFLHMYLCMQEVLWFYCFRPFASLQASGRLTSKLTASEGCCLPALSSDCLVALSIFYLG